MAALDFDLACAFRLELYDMEKMKTQARLIASEVSKMFGSGDSSEGGGQDISKYDTSATVVW